MKLHIKTLPVLTTVTTERNQNSKSHLARLTGAFQITCLMLAAVIAAPASHGAAMEKGNISVDALWLLWAAGNSPFKWWMKSQQCWGAEDTIRTVSCKGRLNVGWSSQLQVTQTGWGLVAACAPVVWLKQFVFSSPLLDLWASLSKRILSA